VVFVLVDEIEVEESRAGIEEDAIDSKIDGVGCRVGRTIRGLPNVGRDNDIGVGVGWRRVGKEVEIGSLICFEMIWLFESNRQ
jgi:hypothetical protein